MGEPLVQRQAPSASRPDEIVIKSAGIEKMVNTDLR